MFQTMRNAWKVKDLRKKILYTLLVIIIFRIGCVLLPVPFLDTTALKDFMEASSADGNFLGYMDMLTGGALSQATIFSLGISPYINASIIIQLLTYALPPLERLSKEGEEGRRKINRIQSILAIVMSGVLGYGYYTTVRYQVDAVTYTEGFEGIFAAVVIIGSFMAGASFVVWLGNQLNEKGLGNGISIILLAGIIARGPSAVYDLLKKAFDDPNQYAIIVPVVIIIFIAMVSFIVFMNNSERRIPVQYAKRVVGRKQYGGQSTHIPIKVCMSGVMPIIFAGAFMSLPMTIAVFAPPSDNPVTTWETIYANFINLFKTTSWLYAILYFLLIIGFNYFYVSMQYNPIEIANNLRQSNGGIPGIRPGQPTSDFVQRVLSKITLVGAVFLGIIAIFPIFMSMALPSISSVAMGGTSILIVVSVALETVRTLESQMMMRHHKGFLE